MNTPTSPAQWLYGLLRALPGDEFLFVTVVCGLRFCLPGWVDITSAALAPATDARTTRLRRTQLPSSPRGFAGFGTGPTKLLRRRPPSVGSPTSHLCRSKSRRKRSSTARPMRQRIAHEVHLALQPQAHAMLPRPPHPIPTYSDDGRRPSSG